MLISLGGNMTEEENNKLEELTLCINMDLNILYNALKYVDEDLDIAALSYFSEKIYKKSCESRNLF